MDTDESDILQVLIRHESIIGALYQAFATMFPAREQFWRALAEEERGHAQKLRELGSEPSVDRWLRVESGLRPQALKSSIGYVQSQIDRARRGELTPVQALSIARDLENALIEEHFSRMARSPHVAASPVLMELAVDTERHRRSLSDELETERRTAR